ncbi:S8 family peptidase [Chitinophaga agrisoli]|nr:S8 family peptidase [Chitinophaga agrisoli]
MRHIVARSLLVLLLLFLHLQLSARQQPGTDTLLKRYANLINTKAVKDSGDNAVFYLVRFRVYPGTGALNRYGIVKVLNRLYFILQQPVTDTTLLHNVVYTYPANNNWKSSDQLLRQLEKLKDHDSLRLQLTLDTSLALPEWCHIQRIQAKRFAIARVRKQDWPQFIAQAAVRSADAIRQPKTEIIISGNDMTLNRVSTVQQLYPNLQGANMTVSLKENLFDTADTDLTGRYADAGLASDIIDSHATIMGTLIAGAGNSGPEGKGAAPQARLSSSDFANLLPDDATVYGRLGIRLQNHSYGTGIENYYGAEAMAYDQQIVAMDTMMHVFSSGNDGDQAAPDGIYSGIPGWANLSGTYKQAKNVLVAGGTDGGNLLPVGSAKGPAYDGRVKPELAAYGLDGTSNASALTSGISTLVQDAYRQQFGQTPPAVLVKTILINSADDIGNAHVDYSSGYGAVNALLAINAVREQRFRSGSAANGSGQDIALTVPAGTGQVKITLGWPDPPAAENAPKALVNDLDLWVTNAAGNRYEPWILSSFPDADSLQAPARRGRDTLNNTEQVTIDNPSGVIRVHISGASVPQGPQPFYISYQYTPRSYFRWDNPAPGSKLAAGSTIPLRWATSRTGTGTLYYSLDSVRWNTIILGQSLAEGTYSWQVPDVFSKVWLRMLLNDTAYVSQAFYVSPAPELHVGFDCTDSAMLYWPAIPNASGYEVYALTGTHLSVYTRTNNTSVIIPKATVGGTWFTISAIHRDGWTGVQANGLDYRNQGLSCYVSALLADPQDNQRVVLALSLGSLYNLRTIWWERLSAGSFTPLQSTPVSSGVTDYTITDDSPQQGINLYRVRLETTDGRMILSDTASAVILTDENAFFLYPNPVPNTLQLLSRSSTERLCRIVDISGREVRRLIVTNTQESIDVAGLAPGVYVLALYEGGKEVFVRKWVKL